MRSDHMIPTNTNPPTPRLLSTKECAAKLGISIATFWRRSADGTFQRPMKIGKRSLWSEAEIDGFIERLIEERTAA